MFLKYQPSVVPARHPTKLGDLDEGLDGPDYIEYHTFYLLHMTTEEMADGLKSIDRIEGQLRSFDYKNGSLVDNGYELKGLGKAIGRKRGENRRATCPEIYLYPESTTPARQVLLRLYGSRNAGKKTLAHQIYHVASTTTPEQTHVISVKARGASRKPSTFF
ncbi:hypothetical protein OSTOST_24885 [Ostertagia ostertagi]